ncbi:uncharacterized protein LOC144863724 isoform X1 [Branchiostoma floridae x Branchiostoma japonicum]
MTQEIVDEKIHSEVERLVQLYDLLPHPEGGWFKETFKSTVHCQNEHLHGNKDSRVATVCYYLLPKNGMSHWHRLASDEIWLYHDGGCLKVHMIDEKGVYSSAVLGSSLEHPEARYGVLVPAEVWLAAEPTNGGNFSFISCMVAPGKHGMNRSLNNCCVVAIYTHFSSLSCTAVRNSQDPRPLPNQNKVGDELGAGGPGLGHAYVATNPQLVKDSIS